LMDGKSDEVLAKVKDVSANPAPLGLLGFGMTTVLLNIHNTGYYGLGAMILAMGIFYGGIAQVIAGVMEWKKGNTFGTTAFTSYGLFWLSLVALLLLPTGGKLATPTTAGLLGWYFISWGVFTLVMFVATLRINRALQVVFFTLFVLFFLLAAHEFSGNAALGKVAGWEGIICGLSAIYAGLAQVLNEVYGKTIAPLGPVKR
jgi:succinate-acetate transporter protein